MTTTQTYLGESADLGSYTTTGPSGSLTGTTVLVRFGLPNQAAELELRSATPPSVGLCTWTIAEGGASATLRLDLHQDQIAEIGVGDWIWFAAAVRTSDGVVLPRFASGRLIVRPTVLPPAP